MAELGGRLVTLHGRCLAGQGTVAKRHGREENPLVSEEGEEVANGGLRRCVMRSR